MTSLSGFQTSTGDNLTKFPTPLIIIVSRLNFLHNRGSGTKRLICTQQEEFAMKVSVYVDEKGRLDVLVQASPGKGRSPVIVSDVTLENIVGMVGPIVTQMRRPKGEKIDLPSS